MDAVPAALAEGVAGIPAGALCVAFSGGSDSVVLLHALSKLAAARERGLRALHVEHGLHPDSQQWSKQCADFAARFDVPCRCIGVTVDSHGQGIEAAAREARYAALQAELTSGELLLTAHHGDDQAETVLLRLLHSAGAEGLAGMRRLRLFGTGWLWRPLLDLPRATLLEYAQQHALTWIEDPSNRDARFARSFLRQEILPALRRRWPDAAARLARSAERLRGESDLLLAEANRSLAMARTLQASALRIDVLLAQPPALQRLVLGLWLDECGLARPPAPVWERAVPELLLARRDAEPRIAWGETEMRRYRDLLYCMPKLPEVNLHWSREWDGMTPLDLPTGFGRLRFDPVPEGGVPERGMHLQVRPRRGGERIRLHGEQHSDLRKRLQEIGLPPWQRERLPLLFDAAGELQAAGDLLLASSFRTRLSAMNCQLLWQPDAGSV